MKFHLKSVVWWFLFFFLVLFITVTISIYSSIPESKSENTRPYKTNAVTKIGSINFDPVYDDEKFYFCDEKNIMEYYQVGPKYKEGIKSVNKYYIVNQHKLNLHPNFNGYITVRFIVNCKGETNRYRVEGVNFNYEQLNLSKDIKSSLTKLVVNMGKWNPGVYEEELYDSYKFITLKVIYGEVIDVIP